MKIAALTVALGLAGARSAHADRLACVDPAVEQKTLAARNVKTRDAALAALGLKVVAAPIAARGAQPSKPAGNIVWIKLRVGCNTEVAKEVVFAVDKARKAYRIKPKVTLVEVPVYACGGPDCGPLCGMPPKEQSFAFQLPAGVTYAGEREVALKQEIARITYDQPHACGKNGQPIQPAAPVAPSPPRKPTRATTPPAPPQGATSDLEKLRAENAALRAENAALKKQIADERKRLEAQQKQLSTKLK